MGPCLASRGGFCSRSSLSSLDSFSISLALDEAWSPLSTGPEAFSCSGLVAKEVAGGLGYRLERALELEDDDSKTYIRSLLAVCPGRRKRLLGVVAKDSLYT